MNLISLKNNKGFPWYNSGELHVKGYLYDHKDRLFTGKDLLSYFGDIKSFPDFEERVKYANGCFAVVDAVGEELYIASDIARSIPLFYYRSKEYWIVSDDPYFIAERMKNIKLNNIAVYEYLASGFVTGRETLIEQLLATQAGEVMALREKDIKRKFYFSYRTSKPNDDDYQEVRETAMRILEETMAKFIATLDNRTVLVPLSGGYGSRMLLAFLKKYEYSNVLAFTYGRHDNRYMEVAREVAEKLEIPWLKIEYDETMIESFMDEEFEEYYKFASHLSSSFSLQDYFAARHLSKNGLVPENSIVASAHAGNFLGGSQLFKHSNVLPREDLNKIAKRIFYIKYSFKRPGKKVREDMIHRIEKSLQEKFTGTNSLAYSVQEDWDFKEKLTKLNFNSINAYTYFGYEFRFPFRDIKLVEFFRSLPLETRLNKFLFDDILTNEYFKPLGLNFKEEIEPDEKFIRSLKLKNKIKYYLPEAFKRMYLGLKKQESDPEYSREITEHLVKDMHREGKKIKIYGSDYNSLIMQWYLNKTIQWIDQKKEVEI